MSLKPVIKTFPACDICQKGFGNGHYGRIEMYTLSDGTHIKAHKICKDYKDVILKQKKVPA